jgi:hypothetical protein
LSQQEHRGGPTKEALLRGRHQVQQERRRIKRGERRWRKDRDSNATTSLHDKRGRATREAAQQERWHDERSDKRNKRDVTREEVQ